jgi:hypothetical protein
MRLLGDAYCLRVLRRGWMGGRVDEVAMGEDGGS